jgi:hypothetical protein
MAYATDREDFKIDDRILDAIQPSMPSEFAQLREERKNILDELEKGDPAKQAELRGKLLRTSVKAIGLYKDATPDNFRSGVAVDVPGRSFRIQPKQHTGRLIKEYPSTDETSEQ